MSEAELVKSQLRTKALNGPRPGCEEAQWLARGAQG